MAMHVTHKCNTIQKSFNQKKTKTEKKINLVKNYLLKPEIFKISIDNL